MTDLETKPDSKAVAVGKLERVAKPDKSKHEAEIAVLQNEIKTLQGRMSTIRSELDDIQAGRNGAGDEMSVAKEKMAGIRAEKDKLLQERAVISANLKDMQAKVGDQAKSQKSLRSEIKYTSLEEINQQIAYLKHEQETKSMKLSVEKKLIKDIESLQQSKKMVYEYSKMQESTDGSRQNIKMVKMQLGEKAKQLDEVTARFQNQKQVLDELYEMNSGEREKVPSLIEERKAIKSQLDDKFNAIRELRSSFKEANDVYYAYLRRLREERKEQRRLEELKQKEEYEKRLADYEKEMESIHPYQDEIDMCDSLVKYLKSVYSKELDEATTSAEIASEVSPSQSVSMDGIKPLKRVEEDFMMLGVGKKKSGKKKVGKKAVKISLPMARVETYTAIGLLPPASVSAVSNSIDEIIKRKEEFKQMTRELKKAAQAQDEAQKKENSIPSSGKNGKNGRRFNADAETEFPSLGRGASSVEASGAWGGNSQKAVNEAPVEVEIEPEK